MKYISKWYIACLAMVLCCWVSACSDEEQQAPVEVSFTEPAALDMARLDSCESIVTSFELASNGAWHLCSDKMWMKLSLLPDGDFYNDIQGGEGKYTVYIKVTNDARGFNDAKAVLSLIAGDKSREMFSVMRGGLERTFALLSSGGEEIERIEIGQAASVWVMPEANFDCAILGCPIWLDEPEALSGGFTLNVASAFVPFEKEGVVAFGNIDGSTVYEVPVSYAGMDPTVMRIDGEHTPWGWEVSLDGKTFQQETTSALGESEEKVVEEALVYSVECFNYDCNFVAVQVEDGQLSLLENDAAWISAVQDDNDPSLVSVTVKPFSATSSERSRSAYLFAIPAALYDEFVSSLAASSDADAFVDGYLSYVLVELQQKDLEGSDGFIVTGNDGATVSCVTEQELYEWLCSEYSITDVTTCNLVPGEVYTLDTRLTPAEWAGNYGLADREGTQPRLKLWSPTGDAKGPQAVLGDDGTYRMEIKVPATLDKLMILRLYTPQIVNIKAIVIRPVTN